MLSLCSHLRPIQNTIIAQFTLWMNFLKRNKRQRSIYQVRSTMLLGSFETLWLPSAFLTMLWLALTYLLANLKRWTECLDLQLRTNASDLG